MDDVDKCMGDEVDGDDDDACLEGMDQEADEEEDAVEGGSTRAGIDSVVDLTLVLNMNVKVVLCQCGRAFRVPPWEMGTEAEAEEKCPAGGDREGVLVPVKEGFKKEEAVKVAIADDDDEDSLKGGRF